MRIYKVPTAEFPAHWRTSFHQQDRVLSLEDAQEMRRLRGLGWKHKALAAMFNVSQRTTYRTCEGEHIDVTVGEWTATFQVIRGRTPIQIGTWLRDA